MIRYALLPFLFIVATCGGEDTRSDPRPEDSPPPPAAGQSYERALVFTTLSSDSVLLVPWILEARAHPGGVDRRARSWLYRAGEWDAFLEESWQAPPTDAPWRIHPRGPLRLIVGPDDALERLSFTEGSRRLEVALGSSLAEWSGRRGEVLQLAEGRLVLGEANTPGLVLDINRAWQAAEGEGGDWLFVVSGDSLQVILHTPLAAEDRAAGAWRGWARLDFRSLPLSGVTLEWASLRAFDAARREVPVSWTLTSSDAPLEGALQVRTPLLEAGEGDGPLLPVDALFAVEGTISLEGGAYPVRGLYRHTQGS